MEPLCSLGLGGDDSGQETWTVYLHGCPARWSYVVPGLSASSPVDFGAMPLSCGEMGSPSDNWYRWGSWWEQQFWTVWGFTARWDHMTHGWILVWVKSWCHGVKGSCLVPVASAHNMIQKKTVFVLPTIISLAFSCQVSAVTLLVLHVFNFFIFLLNSAHSDIPIIVIYGILLMRLRAMKNKASFQLWILLILVVCSFHCDLPWLVQLINSKLTYWIHHFSYTFKCALANNIQRILVRHTQLSISLVERKKEYWDTGIDSILRGDSRPPQGSCLDAAIW